MERRITRVDNENVEISRTVEQRNVFPIKELYRIRETLENQLTELNKDIAKAEEVLAKKKADDDVVPVHEGSGEEHK